MTDEPITERLHRLAVQVEALRELAWEILDRLVDEERERVADDHRKAGS